MANVKFENVSKKYNKTTILEKFNLEIQDKEFLVLVGPSGCGKSTTLRLVAGLETVSDGKLFIDGKLVNDIAPRDRDIAMVFQDYALYPHLTVEQNMGFGLKMRGASKQEIKEKVENASNVLGLQHLLARKPKELSGGQRQRVAIGRAIVRNPKVFLFDEPLSNLDAKLRVQMRVEISRLHKKLDSTIVYVTHDQIEAMTLADRIVVMKDGFIQQLGTPIELYEKPANAFVGSFIGSPAMNQVPGNFEKSDVPKIIGNSYSLKINGKIEKIIEENAPDNKVILGIRPQDLKIIDNKDDAFLSATVDIVEPIGSETYVYFSTANEQWTAKCEGLPNIKEGEAIHWTVDLDKLHIFNSDEKRIN